MKNRIKKILKQTLALVILKISGTFAGGSLAGLQLWQSALLASFVGIMEVAEDISRSALDGELTDDEIDTAFIAAGEDEDKA